MSMKVQIGNRLADLMTKVNPAPMLQSGDVPFDAFAVGLVLAAVSFSLIGVIMAGAALFPQQAEQYKRQIPTVIGGLILIGVGSAIIGAFGGG
jgi:hypothetical protein